MLLIKLMVSFLLGASICQIEQGDTGKLRYRGETLEEAMRKVSEQCVMMRMTQYIKKYGYAPNQDRAILFVESCVNSLNCIEDKSDQIRNNPKD